MLAMDGEEVRLPGSWNLADEMRDVVRGSRAKVAAPDPIMAGAAATDGLTEAEQGAMGDDARLLSWQVELDKTLSSGGQTHRPPVRRGQQLSTGAIRGRTVSSSLSGIWSDAADDVLQGSLSGIAIGTLPRLPS
jgi:hypothetical protein